MTCNAAATACRSRHRTCAQRHNSALTAQCPAVILSSRRDSAIAHIEHPSRVPSSTTTQGDIRMKTSRFASVMVGTVLILGAGWSLVHAQSTPVGKKALSGTYLNFLEARKAMAAGQPVTTARSAVIRVPSAGFQLFSAGALADGGGDGGGLPLFSFDARAARDGHRYKGTMIGSSPFTNPQSASVPAFIVPVILHIHSIATAIDPKTGAITSVPGDFIVDPTARDNVCLAAPNNVPAKLLRQTPIFEPANFSFGGTSVGKTQYIDAFMRANFFKLPGVQSNYHLKFGPVNTLQAIGIDGAA